VQFKWQHRLGQATAELNDASCKFKNGKGGDMESKAVCRAKPGCIWDGKQTGSRPSPTTPVYGGTWPHFRTLILTRVPGSWQVVAPALW